MAYAAPGTTTVGQLITAARLNQELRDNVVYLKGIADGLSVTPGTLAVTGTGAHTIGSGGDGELGIGTAPGYPLHVLSDDPARVAVEHRSADAGGPELFFLKGRGSLATIADISAADAIGSLAFWGYRTAGYRQGAALIVTAPTVGSSLISGQMSLRTATAAGTLTEAMRITETQQALFVAGTVAAPAVAGIGDPDTGLVFAGTNILNISAGGSEAIRASLVAAAPNVGFFGSGGGPRPDISGSRGGNVALADLLTELATLGLITNSSSA